MYLASHPAPVSRSCWLSLTAWSSMWVGLSPPVLPLSSQGMAEPPALTPHLPLWLTSFSCWQVYPLSMGLWQEGPHPPHSSCSPHPWPFRAHSERDLSTKGGWCHYLLWKSSPFPCSHPSHLQNQQVWPLRTLIQGTTMCPIPQLRIRTGDCILEQKATSRFFLPPSPPHFTDGETENQWDLFTPGLPPC